MDWLRRLQTSELARNFSVLATGTAISQGVLVLAYPVITRIFAPGVFGVFGVFASMVATLGVIANLRYEFAIPLPSNNRDGAALTVASCASSLCVSLVISLGVVILADHIGAVWEIPELIPLLPLVPIGVFFVGIYQAFLFWQTRQKGFGLVARGQIGRAAALVGSQVGLGLVGLGAFGLAAGRILGEIAGAAILGWRSVPQLAGSGLPRPIARQAVGQMREYVDFPKFSAPQGFLNSASQHVPTLLLAALCGAEATGAFVVSVRLLQMPAAVVKRSLTQVLLERMSVLRNERGDYFGLFRRSVLFLVAGGVVPVLAVCWLGPRLAPIVLGKDWSGVGEFVRWLSIWALFWLASAPASVLAQVLRRQRELLFYNVGLFGARTGALIVGDYWGGAIGAVALFSLVGAILNIVLIVLAARWGRDAAFEDGQCDA